MNMDQTIVDKLSMITFELCEVIRKSQRPDLSEDDKMALSQDEYDLEERLHQYFLLFEQTRQYYKDNNLLFEPDLTILKMAGEEHEQTVSFRLMGSSAQNPIVIE